MDRIEKITLEAKEKAGRLQEKHSREWQQFVKQRAGELENARTKRERQNIMQKYKKIEEGRMANQKADYVALQREYVKKLKSK